MTILIQIAPMGHDFISDKSNLREIPNIWYHENQLD